MNPFMTAAFALQAGFVFTLRSMQLWAEPAKAGAQLTEFVLEKQRAFVQGMAAAGKASLAGADAPAVFAAALGPAQRRVRANALKLIGGR